MQNTYYAYWNTSTKNWFETDEGDEFKEGVLYKVQVPVKANAGYRLNPEATGSLQYYPVDTPVPAESIVVFSNIDRPDMERLFLSLVVSGTDCKASLAGHKYTDRWNTEDHPSNVCLNSGCEHIFGDVNDNGVLNIIRRTASLRSVHQQEFSHQAR